MGVGAGLCSEPPVVVIPCALPSVPEGCRRANSGDNGEVRVKKAVLGWIGLWWLVVGSAHAAPFAYITNDTNPGTVTVIDTATNMAVGNPINVGLYPHGVAATPSGSRVYVTNTNDSTVSVIDTTTNTSVDTINLGSGTGPQGIAVTPSGSLVYVANATSSTVSVIDTTTNTLVGTIHVGNTPQGILVTPNGSLVYVANATSSTVSVIDTTTNTLVGTIQVGNGPEGIAVNPDGSRIYVANYGSNTVSVIDTTTNTSVDTINLGSGTGPQGIAVTPDGAHVYVTNIINGTVTVIQTSDNTVVGAINVGVYPLGVAVTPDGSRVYVANYHDSTVSVIDTATRGVTTLSGMGLNSPLAFGAFIVSGPPPTLSGVSPLSGPVAGGTNVTITGTNLSNVLSVTFGGILGTITARTATSIMVTAPAHPSGATDVVVTTANGSATAAGAFTYLTAASPPSSVPTLSEWAQMLLALMVMGMAWRFHHARESGA